MPETAYADATLPARRGVLPVEAVPLGAPPLPGDSRSRGAARRSTPTSGAPEPPGRHRAPHAGPREPRLRLRAPDSLPVADTTGSLPTRAPRRSSRKRDFAAAKSAVERGPGELEYTLQAQYLLGVILPRRRRRRPGARDAAATPAATPRRDRPPPRPRFAPAIEQFRKVTRMPAHHAGSDTSSISRGWRSAASSTRPEAYLDAAEAYSHVDRTSPEFSTMLYELAWVYVRLGDYQRAQRALEVLTIADPNSLDIADGSLLARRSHAALGPVRQGAHALPVRARPFRSDARAGRPLPASTSDPAVYYDKLTPIPTCQTDDKLPQVALAWARERPRTSTSSP